MKDAEAAYPVVIPMTVEEFRCMPHRLGWKHEYWDGAARLSISHVAVAEFRLDISTGSHVNVPGGYKLQGIAVEDERELIELFIRAFAGGVNYAGYSHDALRSEATKDVNSFFNPQNAEKHRSRPAIVDASFLVAQNEEIVGAILVRNSRLGPIVEPIMVAPEHQRQSLATVLLRATSSALRGKNTEEIYSRCHMGNSRSLAWHEHNGFEEMPSYFSANHRVRHYTAMAAHFKTHGAFGKAQEMKQLAQKWQSIVVQIEDSEDRFSCRLLD